MNAELFRRLHPLFSAFLTPETAGILLTLARPALRLTRGTSPGVHLGGSPLLPAGEPWPTASGRPLAHLSTIAFAELPPLDGLPGSGHASFYYSGSAHNWWDDFDTRETWRVYAHDMKPAVPPVSSAEAKGQSWSATPFWSLPSPLDPALGLLEQARPGTLGTYRPLYESWLEQVWPDEGPRHQLGGWPVLLEPNRPMGPPTPCEPSPPKAPPYLEPKTSLTKPPLEPRADQVVRLSDYRRPATKRRRTGATSSDPRKPLPISRRASSKSAPTDSRLSTENPTAAQRESASVAALRPVADSIRSASAVRAAEQASCLSPRPTREPKSAARRAPGLDLVTEPAIRPPIGLSDTPSTLARDHLAKGMDRDPAFLYPRIPRHSVSVLPSNVDSIRLDEVRAAIAAARSRSADAQQVAEGQAKKASDARRSATRRLTELLRERLSERRLVLQLDSDPSLGWFWGDPGFLYFTVQPDAPLESAWLNRQAL
ncbi:DUF1963 domain-containing protein [Actinomadura gamaensis]|uniref:DUF1963 domain-containing protein n=1 Tax=Actinomadura gamaensis TaxID=1763541 RepID=A0ABV9TQB1_9ACTN